MTSFRDITIKEIVLCYERQFPDRVSNFESLFGFPSHKFKNIKNKKLKQLCEYYELLLEDFDFLITLIRTLIKKQESR